MFWSGVLEWIFGLEYWSGVLEWWLQLVLWIGRFLSVSPPTQTTNQGLADSDSTVLAFEVYIRHLHSKLVARQKTPQCHMPGVPALNEQQKAQLSIKHWFGKQATNKLHELHKKYWVNAITPELRILVQSAAWPSQTWGRSEF